MPRDPIHPGITLQKDILEEYNMTGSDLAKILKVPANRIYQIIAGKRAITADTALRLSQWLGTSAEFWLNLQKLYELRIAEKEHGTEIKKQIKQHKQEDHITSASF